MSQAENFAILKKLSTLTGLMQVKFEASCVSANLRKLKFAKLNFTVMSAIQISREQNFAIL